MENDTFKPTITGSSHGARGPLSHSASVSLRVKSLSVEAGTRYRAEHGWAKPPRFILRRELFACGNKFARIFADIAYAIRIGEAVEADVKHISVGGGCLGEVLVFFRVSPDQSADPTELPVVVGANDIVLINWQALFVEKASPAIEQRRHLWLDVRIKEGTVLWVPHPVSQRLNQRYWCLIHRLCMNIRHPVRSASSNDYGRLSGFCGKAGSAGGTQAEIVTDNVRADFFRSSATLMLALRSSQAGSEEAACDCKGHGQVCSDEERANGRHDHHASRLRN